MSNHMIEIMAGFTSSMIFVSGNLPMLFKAFRTKDLHSYSLLQLILGNIGNTVYWLYVISLPVGPVWYLQAFFSTSSGLMLFFYLHYEKKWFRVNQQNILALSRISLPAHSLTAGENGLNPLTPAVLLICKGGPACKGFPACYQRLQLLNSIKGLAGAADGRSRRPANVSESRPAHEYLRYLRRQADTGVPNHRPDPIPVFPREALGPVKASQPLFYGESYGSGLLSVGGVGPTSYPLKIGNISGNISYQCVVPAISEKAGLFPAVPMEGLL